MKQGQVGRLEYALLVALVALTGLSIALLAAQIIAPQPVAVAGLLIDRLSASVALLVAGVGIVVYRFALRYLDGEPGRRTFLRWLSFTVFAAYILIVASHLLVLFGAWFLTSLGLHQLLTFYRNRAAVHPPARKKFLISRLGDVALLAAIGLIAWQWGTLDLHIFLANLNAPTVPPLAIEAVAVLLVTAALTKSAQFPFHSWLPETMEAPTPVSALMHAGIINAGGVLVLHFAPLLVLAPLALLILVLAGTITAIIGMLAMWAQPNIKRTLAWSTVSQMGFMMVQLGLAAFPAAILHLIGHGCYKAWSFLRSGGLPLPTAPAPKLAPAQTLMIAAIGTLAAIPALALAAMVTGFDPFHSPGELALSGIVALAIGQLWVACFQAPRAPAASMVVPALAAIVATPLAALLAFGLYHGAYLFYSPALGTLAVPSGPLAWIAAVLPCVAFLLLVVFYAVMPALGRTPPAAPCMSTPSMGFISEQLPTESSSGSGLARQLLRR